MNNYIKNKERVINTEIKSETFHAFNPELRKHEIRAAPTKNTEKFIKGPIPLKWITKANALPGKTGNVGIALWFLVGIKGSNTFKITREVETIAACNRKALYQALSRLEEAMLIKVERSPGARANVTLLLT